jgi:hypothetical protein
MANSGAMRWLSSVGLVGMILAAGCTDDGRHDTAPKASSAAPRIVDVSFVRAFTAAVPNPGGPFSTYKVAVASNSEVRAGQAFFVFADPHITKECIGHATLDAQVVSGSGDVLALYPSWPSYAVDAQPGADIGPETLMDNRPRADAHPRPGARAQWDVTDLVEIWWGSLTFPSGHTIRDHSDLVVVATPVTSGEWILSAGTADPPTLRIENICPI